MSNNKVTQVAIVTTQAKFNPTQTVEQMAFFDVTGSPISVAPDTGATVLMTSYTAHAVGSVAAGDTLNVAMAKLEARIAALEA